MFLNVKIENFKKLLINKCWKYLCAQKFFINLQTQNSIAKSIFNTLEKTQVTTR